MQKNPPSSEELETIPGDTYAVRAELKTLGAVWDASERAWRIAPEKLPFAIAIVENQTLAPAAASPTDIEAISDPFEDDAEGPRLVSLDKADGATYEARDALRAVGARWDKNQRSWLIREDKAEYARAVLTAGATVPSAPAAPAAPAAPVFRDPPPSPSVSEYSRSKKENSREVERQATPPPLDPVTTTGPYQQGAIRPMATDRIKLGGLWLNKTKDGREYLSGRLSPTVKILIFKNDFKSTDTQPSHVMYLAPIEQDETQRQNTPAPDSFFGEISGGPSEGGGRGRNGDMSGGGDEPFDGGDFGADDFDIADEEPPAPPVRSNRLVPPAQSAAPQRPSPPSGSGNRPAPERPVSGGRPASQAPPARRPSPPPARNDRADSDLSDPFEE